MTKVYVDDTVYTVNISSAASDTTVSTSGSGNSLINTSLGGNHTLNSLAAGTNVTITSDSAGTLTIAATEDNLSNNTTTDLTEGTNQYFTDARVMTSLATVSGDIIPDGHKTRDLGSTGNAWKSVYVGDGSLYIDGTKVLGSDATGQIDFTTDVSQNLNFQAGGTITMLSAGQVTTLGDSTVNLGPSVGGGVINARGRLEAPDVHIGSLELESGLINSTGTSQNLEIRSNGTGYVHLNTVDVYIGSPITTAVKIDGTSITTTAGNLTISATGTVDVAGHYTSAETDTAISNAGYAASTGLSLVGNTFTNTSPDQTVVLTGSGATSISGTYPNFTINSTDTNTDTNTTYTGGTGIDLTGTVFSTDSTIATKAYADAAVAVLTNGASATHDTLLEIQNLMATDAELSSAISGLNHDALAGFVANEHIDWTVTGNTVHADNYTNTDTNTTYTAGTNVSISGSNVISSTDTNTDTVYTAFNTDFDTRLGTKNTANLTEGTNLYHTDTRAISAVEGEATLDLTGTVKVGDLELSNYSQWGENFGKLKATGTDQNLCLEASDGTGYFIVKSPNLYLGAASGVKVTNASGVDTTLSGFGYSGEGLNITADLVGATTNAKRIVSNVDGSTIPGVTQWGGWNILTNGAGIGSAVNDTSGYPFVGYARSTNINNPQPVAQYLVNYMDYDISSGLAGHGVSVQFAAQDETGKLIGLAQNLCKIRNSTISGSAGSSTVDTWDSEYTLTVTGNSGSGDVGTNVITTNVDFTQVKKELRVTDAPGNSGNTNISGLYLTYDGAQTGTPSAKIQLQNSGANTTATLMELSEDRTTFTKVTKQYKASSDPTGEAGDTYFNTSTAKFRGHDGTNWTDLN